MKFSISAKHLSRNFAFLVLLFFISGCKHETNKRYQLSPEKLLNAYISKEDMVTKEKLANILLCNKETVYQLVDIRTPHEFIISHIKGAINIPAKDILDEEYFYQLNQDEKILVLYSTDAGGAIGPYLILKQLGYKNIKIALGGFDYINQYVINSYGIKTGAFEDEKPRYDFLRLIASTDMPKVDSIIRPTFKRLNTNKIIRDFDEECPDLN